MSLPTQQKHKYYIYMYYNQRFYLKYRNVTWDLVQINPILFNHHVYTKYKVTWNILFKLTYSTYHHYHTAHCHMWTLWQAWLQAFGSSYGLAATWQLFIYIMWRHAHGGTIRNQNCDNRAVSVHGYWIFYDALGWLSQYTGPPGIRTSHVFRPGIESGSTVWKSRMLTTQPATHMHINTLVEINN